VKRPRPLADALRLEIEGDPRPGDLVNLIKNPNGDLGGWGWITPVSGSTLTGVTIATQGPTALVYSAPAGASYFTSEALPVAAGVFVAASFVQPGIAATGATWRLRFEWLNSAGVLLSSSIQSVYGAVALGPIVAPASTAYVRWRFDLYADTNGGNPTGAHTLTFNRATVATAPTVNGIPTTLTTNYVTNPSLEVDLTGFTYNTAFSSRDPSTPTQSATRAFSGTKSALVTMPVMTLGTHVGWHPTGLTIGQTYTFSVWVYVPTGSPDVRAEILFFANGPWNTTKDKWIRLTATYKTTATGLFVGVQTKPDPVAGKTMYVDAGQVELGALPTDYLDGSLAAVSGASYAWTGTAHASASTRQGYTPLGTIRTNLVPDPSVEATAAGDPSWERMGTTSWAGDATTAYDGARSIRLATNKYTDETITPPSTYAESRRNLIPNPSFTNDANWWTHQTGTLSRVGVTVPSGAAGVALRMTGAGSSDFLNVQTWQIGVSAGSPISFSAYVQRNSGANWKTVTGSVVVRFYNSGGAEVGPAAFGASVAVGSPSWYRLTGTGTVPAGAVSAVLIVGVNNSGGAVIGTGMYANVASALMEHTGGVGGFFDGSSPPSGVLSYAWTGPAGASASIENTRTDYAPYVVRHWYAATDGPGIRSNPFPVSPGSYYAVSAATRTDVAVSGTAYARVDWLDVNGADMGVPSSVTLGTISTAWKRHTTGAPVTAPAGAAFARVWPWFSSVEYGVNYYVDAVQVEAGQVVGSFILGSTSTADLTYVPPVPYVNILGPTHDLTISREALNVGTLTATIVDATLDPAVSTVIRPGRACRVTAYSNAAKAFRPVFTGAVSAAEVAYELKEPAVSKRARIALTAVDNVKALSNQKRENGVATIAELPAVLEGCGVPWNVNGSGAQVPSAITVATNDNASAVDQIAVTRDSVTGFAWVDAKGVLQAWDRNRIATALAGPTLTESVYSDIGVGYNTGDLINEVSLSYLRLNPDDNTAETITYGPYRDDPSIRQWGVVSADFTVQGIVETPANMAAYATAVLAKNSTPTVRVNDLDLTVELTDDRQAVNDASWFAFLDLYDLVAVSCERAGKSAEQSRVTSIKHSISGPASLWTVEVGFAAGTVVASPSFVPLPTIGGGDKTIGQLLRPIGEVTMWFGASNKVPAGWLLCDGNLIPSTYPDLIALVGSRTPDMTDRFPIGAGTKALGTGLGAAAVTLGGDHLPQHAHSLPMAVGGAPAGVNDVGLRASGAGDPGFRTGITLHWPSSYGSAAWTQNALPILNPYRALWFIIRAR
jgi:hypothetical protein